MTDSYPAFDHSVPILAPPQRNQPPGELARGRLSPIPQDEALSPHTPHRSGPPSPNSNRNSVRWNHSLRISPEEKKTFDLTPANSIPATKTGSGSSAGSAGNISSNHLNHSQNSSNNLNPNPFNFESTYVSSSPVVKASQRRGHRYKHSSVSLQMFQEPEVRAPLAIPLTLPTPTYQEALQSITTDQLMRLEWCAVRIFATGLLFAADNGRLKSVSALAHWAAYDAVVASTVACVHVLSNFDVWRQSTVRLPFALQRLEVLVGFAVAITLLFIGCDSLSHILQDLAGQLLGGESGHHHGHSHEHESPEDGVKSLLLMVGLSGVLSLLSLLPAGLSKAWEVNRTTSVTTLYCAVVLLLPLMGPLQSLFDTMLMPAMALWMIYFGWQASKQFGGMLVMSHDGADVSSDVARTIKCERCVADVTDVALWQVHHELWIATARVTVTLTTQDIIQRVHAVARRAVQDSLALDSQSRCELSLEITLQK